MDFTVQPSTAPENGLNIRNLGDVTGNGMPDYEIQFANGDKQRLYLYP